MAWLLWMTQQWTRECRSLSETAISSPLDICPERGLLDHVLFMFLIFWGPSILLSIAAHQCAFPPTAHESSPFSTPSPTRVISCPSGAGHSNKSEVTCHCASGLQFPDNEWCRASFHGVTTFNEYSLLKTILMKEKAFQLVTLTKSTFWYLKPFNLSNSLQWYCAHILAFCSLRRDMGIVSVGRMCSLISLPEFHVLPTQGAQGPLERPSSFLVVWSP